VDDEEKIMNNQSGAGRISCREVTQSCLKFVIEVIPSSTPLPELVPYEYLSQRGYRPYCARSLGLFPSPDTDSRVYEREERKIDGYPIDRQWRLLQGVILCSSPPLIIVMIFILMSYLHFPVSWAFPEFCIRPTIDVVISCTRSP